MKKLLLLLIACCTIVACQKDSTFVDDNVASVDVMVVDKPLNVLGGLIANPPLGSNSLNPSESGKNPKHGINVRFADGTERFIRAYLNPLFSKVYFDGVGKSNVIVGFGWRGEGGYEVAGGIYETEEGRYWAQDFEGLWSTEDYPSIFDLSLDDNPEDTFSDKQEFFYFTQDQSVVLGECGPEVENLELGGSHDISIIYNGTIDPKKEEDRGDWLRLNFNLNEVKDALAGTVIFTEDEDYLYVEYAENARVYVKPVRVVDHSTATVTLVDGAGTEYVTHKNIIKIEFDEDSNVLSRAFQKGDLLRWFCGDATFAEEVVEEEECASEFENLDELVEDILANQGEYGVINITTCDGNTYKGGAYAGETWGADCGVKDSSNEEVTASGDRIDVTLNGETVATIYVVTDDSGRAHGDGPGGDGVYFNDGTYLNDICLAKAE